MKLILIVAFGGAIGSVARYLLSGYILPYVSGWWFPLSTFTANITGCLAAGILGGLAVKHELFPAEVRLFLFTGIWEVIPLSQHSAWKPFICCVVAKF